MSTPRHLIPTIIAAQFAPTFMMSAVAVALPPIGIDLGAGASSLSLIETLYLGGSVAMLLPAGRLCEAGDKASLYKGALLAFALSSMLIGFLSWMPAILLLRIFQGAMAALVSVAAPSLLTDLVPPERRGRIFGSMLASIYAGLTLGPIVAGYLTDAWGWRAVFIAGGAVLLAARVIGHRVPSQWRWPAPGTVHLPSAGLVALAMVLVVFGTANLRDGLTGYLASAAGLALGALFVIVQRRVARPLLDVALLTENPVLRRALLVQILIYTNAVCVGFMLSIYLQVTLGRSARDAGQILAIGTLFMVFVAPIAGAMADRVRPLLIVMTGVALTAIGSLIAAFLDAGSSLWHIAAVLAVQGVGFGLFSSPNMTIVMNSVPRAKASTAAALTANCRALGQMFGMTIAAALISVFLGNEPVDREPLRFLEPMVAGCWLLAAITAVGLVIGVSGRGLRKAGPLP